MYFALRPGALRIQLSGLRLGASSLSSLAHVDRFVWCRLVRPMHLGTDSAAVANQSVAHASSSAEWGVLFAVRSLLLGDCGEGGDASTLIRNREPPDVRLPPAEECRRPAGVVFALIPVLDCRSRSLCVVDLGHPFACAARRCLWGRRIQDL